jgi:DNA polymerase-3 subunit beta
MDLTLNRAALLEELQLIQGIVERRTAFPILSNILLTAEGDRLHLAATDLDVTLLASCAAAIRREGKATIAGRVFSEVVRSLPSDSLDLTHEENRIEVRSGTFQSKFASLDAADFPTLPEVPQGQGFAVSVNLLHRLLDLTSFAVSPEEGQFQFNAALLNLSPTEVEVVATDGHRLAYARDAHGGVQPPFSQQLIPRKVLSQLRRLPSGDDTPLYLAQGENHLSFRLGERVMLSRILEARFPQYERVLVRDNPHRAVMNRQELLAAFRRVALLASERTRGVQIVFGEDSVSLSSVGFDLGQAAEAVPCRYQGAALSVLVNAQYVIDFLTAVGVDEVEFQLRDADGPLVLTMHGDAPPVADCLYVIMPIRL